MEKCLTQSEFNASLLLLILVTSSIFVLYQTCVYEKFTSFKQNDNLDSNQILERLGKTQDDLHKCMTDKEFYKSDLAKCNSRIETRITGNGPPVRDYNSSNNYQVIGIIYNDTERYPLHGRRQYPGRSDKWEYYITDDSRNHIRMEIKSTNNNELYTGDSVFVDILGKTYTVEIYPYNNFRYTG